MEITIAYYTPAYRGWIQRANRSAAFEDLSYCARAGFRFYDLSPVVSPQPCIAMARNLAVQRAMAMNCSHIFMSDADVWCASGSALAHLFTKLDDKHTAAAAAVRIRQASQRANVVGNGAGAALMLIDLRKLDKLDKPDDVPWFKFVYNRTQTSILVDEGIFFCAQVSRLGGSVVVSEELETIHLAEENLAFKPQRAGGNKLESNGD